MEVRRLSTTGPSVVPRIGLTLSTTSSRTDFGAGFDLAASRASPGALSNRESTHWDPTREAVPDAPLGLDSSRLPKEGLSKRRRRLQYQTDNPHRHRPPADKDQSGRRERRTPAGPLTTTAAISQGDDTEMGRLVFATLSLTILIMRSSPCLPQKTGRTNSRSRKSRHSSTIPKTTGRFSPLSRWGLARSPERSPPQTP